MREKGHLDRPSPGREPELCESEWEERELAEALHQAALAVSSTLDLDQILDHILEQVDRVIKGDAVNIMLIEGERACIVRARGHEPFGRDVLGLSFGITDAPILRRMQETHEPVIIQDTASDPDWVCLPEVAWIRSYAAAPICVRGQVIGFLSLDSAVPGFFARVHADRLRAFAGHASLALSNAQLFHIVEQAKRDWEGTFDAMQDPVVLVDQGGRIVRANRAFAQLVQRSFQEMVGRGYQTVVDGAICPEPLCPLEEATRKRRLATCVHEFRGQVFEIQATPASQDTLEEPAQTAHTIYAMRDITERRRVEREIRLRNRELVLLNRIIAASASSPTIDSFLELVCRELVQVLGVTQSIATLFNEDKTEAVVVAGHPAEGRFQPLGETVPLEQDPCYQYLLQQKEFLVSENVLTDPRLIPCRDLMEHQGIASLLLLPLMVGSDVVGSLRMDTKKPRAFSPCEIDVAQRVADQASNALTRIRLKETQRRLTAAVEQAAEAVVITDTDGTVHYASPAFEQITGYSAQDSMGKSLLQLIGNSGNLTVRAEMWQTVNAGQTWKCRFTNERKDGSLYTVDSTVSPVRNGTGETVNFVATLRDVTREVELEKQFQQAQKMEALGRLAGGIAHDFNNLLTVIHLSTRLLERKLDPADPLCNHVRSIQESSEQAAKLTRQLLSFSHREVIEPRLLDLNQVVGELGQMLKRIIGEDIRLVIDLASDLWSVMIDPGQMEQVLMNLVINARDSMPNGGALTIETANVTLDRSYAASHMDAQPGDHVLLTVSDTGHGMSNEVKSHLFEPFFTTKEQGRGTGLGLSAVFGIVSRSGGHIRVESCMGEGTTFKIFLPRGSGGEDIARVGLPRPSVAFPEHGRETLLVVEDEACVRSLAVLVLKSHGYRVLEAASGPEALQVSEQHDGPIHLLITDVVMPNMNGRELAELLRSQRPGMAVMYMSGYADDAILQLGALPLETALLSKPFAVEDLLWRIRTLLNAVASQSMRVVPTNSDCRLSVEQR
jgi:PAS domain S-box-containing protein